MATTMHSQVSTLAVVILKQLIFCFGGETIESDVAAVCEFASHIWVPCSGLV